MKLHAAATGMAMLEVITDDQISGVEGRRSRSEVVERMASVLEGKPPEALLPTFCERIHAWGQGQAKPDVEPPQPVPAQ